MSGESEEVCVAVPLGCSMCSGVGWGSHILWRHKGKEARQNLLRCRRKLLECRLERDHGDADTQQEEHRGAEHCLSCI